MHLTSFVQTDYSSARALRYNEHMCQALSEFSLKLYDIRTGKKMPCHFPINKCTTVVRGRNEFIFVQS